MVEGNVIIITKCFKRHVNHDISICENDLKKCSKEDDDKNDTAAEETSSNCFSNSFQVFKYNSVL